MVWTEVVYSSFFFQAEDGIRDYKVTGVQDVCSSDLIRGYGLRHLPTTGMSPARPPNGKACSPAVNTWSPLVSRTQKNPSRKTPTLAVPVPFQSPTTGTSAVPPVMPPVGLP